MRAATIAIFYRDSFESQSHAIISSVTVSMMTMWNQWFRFLNLERGIEDGHIRIVIYDSSLLIFSYFVNYII